MKISDKFLFSDQSDLKSLENVLAGKKLSGTAQIIEDYERKLANFFGHKNAVALSSGTAALQASLFALGVRPGDQVIVSSTCPMMSVVSIIYMGAELVFCDTLSDNFGLDLEDLAKLINPKVRAVIDVPMWGYPTNIKDLKHFLANKNVGLIADLAQAHCTQVDKKYMSHYADIACFSTHDRKILATGEGGFILTENDRLRDVIHSFIQFGNMNGIDFGMNYKLGSLQAAVGFNRIDYIQNSLDKRRANAEYIIFNIKNRNVKELHVIDGSQPNYYALLIKLSFKDNSKFIKYLDNAGIPSDIIRYNYSVLYKYPLFEKYHRHCSNSEKLVSSINTLPIHPDISREEMDYMINKINSYEE